MCIRDRGQRDQIANANLIEVTNFFATIEIDVIALWAGHNLSLIHISEPTRPY